MSKKIELIQAAKVAVDELIKVLREPIITHAEDDISADKLKNAASAKRLAFEDALYMLGKIDEEENKDTQQPVAQIDFGKHGFAEGKAKIKNGK
jgi:hypothetical protein